MQTLSRPERRPLNSSTPHPAGNADAGSRHLSALRTSNRTQKKIAKLLSNERRAVAEATYSEAVARAAVEVVPAELRGAVFAKTVLNVTGDPATGPLVADAVVRLDPEAGQLLFADLLRGPRVALRLAADPRLLEQIAALPAAGQILELGRLMQHLEPVRHPKPTPPTNISQVFPSISPRPETP